MDKDNFDIDSILSEVKKRREENEAQIKSADNPKPAPKSELELKQEEPKPEPKADSKKEEFVIVPTEVKPKQPDNQELTEETDNEPEYEEEEAPAKVKKYKNPKQPNKKKKYIVWAVVIALIVAIVAAGTYFYVNFWKPLHQATSNANTQVNEQERTGMDKLVENFDPINETEASQLASLQDMIKTWYNNGSPCSSTHVLNVLLIGEDTRGDEILDDDTRADAAIIASVNIDTGKITLTSILRDAYAYWQTDEDDESSGQFGKINGAMSTGDIDTYISCVEHLYKVEIDDYVIVNFDSFEGIIDTLGGVTLKLTTAEINEINNHPKRYGNVTIDKTFDGDSGKVKLNGKQALAYCRIRKLDSDNARANRQKTCITEVFKETKGASKTKLLKIVKELLPYVSTSCSESKVLKIARYAISQGWLDYKIVMTSVPYANIETNDDAGGIYYGAWCWKADYPQDANYLQMLIYGKSNITLARERVDVVYCEEKGFYSETGQAVSKTIENTNYGEVTTVPTTTKKSEE